jgi:hypothetical protein
MCWVACLCCHFVLAAGVSACTHVLSWHACAVVGCDRVDASHQVTYLSVHRCHACAGLVAASGLMCLRWLRLCALAAASPMILEAANWN